MLRNVMFTNNNQFLPMLINANKCCSQMVTERGSQILPNNKTYLLTLTNVHNFPQVFTNVIKCSQMSTNSNSKANNKCY